MLDGTWKLVYTASSELLPLLALGQLPFVTVGDVTQRINSLTRTAENRVTSFLPATWVTGRRLRSMSENMCAQMRRAVLIGIDATCLHRNSLPDKPTKSCDRGLLEWQVSLEGPFSKTAFSATAALEVSSPKRLQVTFQQGRLATPQLLENLDFPSTVNVFGQFVDLSRLKVRHSSGRVERLSTTKGVSVLRRLETLHCCRTASSSFP